MDGDDSPPDAGTLVYIGNYRDRSAWGIVLHVQFGDVVIMNITDTPWRAPERMFRSRYVMQGYWTFHGPVDKEGRALR